MPMSSLCTVFYLPKITWLAGLALVQNTAPGQCTSIAVATIHATCGDQSRLGYL